MRLLEIFSGTHSIGKVAEPLGYEVISLDRDMPATIKVDIMDWDYTIYEPGYFDIITSSPVCLFWSKLRCCHYGREIKSHPGKIFNKELAQQDIDMFGKPMVDKVREIINYFKPKYWWIENPQTGRMKDYITDLPYYDVDYCMYTDWGYKKRTRFWTNIEDFDAKFCDKQCPGFKDGKHTLSIGNKTQYKKPDGKIVHTASKVTRDEAALKGWEKMKYKGSITQHQKYRIPPKLIKNLLDRCI